MKRREFLETTGMGLVGLALPAPLANLRRIPTRNARQEKPILVVIYLRGGIDPLNAIVPYGDKRYYEIRPTIAVPKRGEQSDVGVIPLDRKFGLHPSLAALEPFWNEDRFVPILNVGSPHPTRSHFDAQDFMEYAAPGLRNVKNGWLNRYLELTRAKKGEEPVLRALAMQGLLPRSLRGSYPVLAAPEQGGEETADLLDFFDDLYIDPAAEMEAPEENKMKGRRREEKEDAVVASGQSTIRAMRRYIQVQRHAASRPTEVTYPRGRLGPRLQSIAATIKSEPDIEVACADWNGWDHHANQGGLGGKYDKMLEHLGQSLAAFAEDLGPHFQRTLILTMSEFGRTCRENGNAGTDHGHGGFMLALGGGLKGREIHGKWTGLDDSDLYEGRDLPVTTDFRDVFAEVLTEHMGFKPGKDFFPEYRPGRKIGFIA